MDSNRTLFIDGIRYNDITRWKGCKYWTFNDKWYLKELK